MPGTHSRLGGSGVERWTQCHGSVGLLDHLGLPPSDEDADYRIEGTAMHEVARHCLVNDLDAWETVNLELGDPAIVITPALANPVQTYLDYCRSLPAQGGSFVEYAISSVVHKDYFGQLDFAAVGMDDLGDIIEIVDLKGGQGIMVEVEDNGQEKYYGFGLIDGIERQLGIELDPDMRVRLTIVQPRGFLEPIRSWDTTVGAIKAWVYGDLVPHMKATEFDDSLMAGEWCRFCPAKLVCPLLTSMFEAGVKANPKHVVDLTNEQVFLNYQAAQAVKHYIKALEKDTYRRLMLGVPGAGLVKLVKKRAFRVWKDGAEDVAAGRFGAAAYTKPAFKSPAQIEELPGAKPWVKQFAFTPDTGLTVALATEPGLAINPPKPGEAFAGYQHEEPS